MVRAPKKSDFESVINVKAAAVWSVLSLVLAEFKSMALARATGAQSLFAAANAAALSRAMTCTAAASVSKCLAQPVIMSNSPSSVRTTCVETAQVESYAVCVIRLGVMTAEG